MFALLAQRGGSGCGFSARIDPGLVNRLDQRGGSGCGFNARIDPGLVNRLVVRGGNGCGLRLRIVPGLRTPGPAAEAEVFVVTMAATTAVAAKAAIFQDICDTPIDQKVVSST